jgi:hypothetical protein
VIVTNNGKGGKLPSVEDRGHSLNGSSYPAADGDSGGEITPMVFSHPLSSLALSTGIEEAVH